MTALAALREAPLILSICRPCTSLCLAACCIVGFASFALATEKGKAPDPSTGPSLVYVSDYFSFIGADAQGRVSFILDNNRGKDGSKYQAEHLVLLHDEQQGWVDIAGSGAYSNSTRELAHIPDSPFFHFDGTPESGLTIISHKNGIELKIGRLNRYTQAQQNGGETWMSSGPAQLTWRGRTIPGRVIYEFVRMPNFNKLTRTYWRLWNNFQGLYLTAGGTDDIYLHSHRSDRLAPLIGKLTGFTVVGEVPESMRDIRIEVLDEEFAPGLFRWPKQWRISWTGNGGTATMTISLTYRKTLSSWFIGGFSVGLITGEVAHGDRTIPVYGLAELIM
jgi:hypothetical protein